MSKNTIPPTQPIVINPVCLAQLRQALCEVGTHALRKFLIDVFINDDLRIRVLMDGPGLNMMARMWNAARRARAYGRSGGDEKEALFCATLVARLADILQETAALIDPRLLCWLDQPGMLDGHIHSALSCLEAEDPDCGWLVRNALGLGAEKGQRAKKAIRLQAMVNLAWLQASPVVDKKPWRRDLTTEGSMRV